MKLYSENKDYKLYQGNMLDMLEVIEPNSIDSIITDPPYGLTSITKRFGKEDSAECQYGKDGSFARLSRGFMGKEWDGSGIEYNIETWQKCYEVLKPGGYLLAFGGSRTFHRIACAIEDAGFEIRDTIMWLYGSGFPKSMDISKSLDKRNGRTNNDFIEFGKYLSNEMNKKNITTIQLAEIGKFYANVNHGGSVSNWLNGKNVPTIEQYKILKETLTLDNSFDWLIEREEAEREVIGKQQYTNSKKFFEYDGERVHLDITIPSTDLAKQWQGWGTALKPSFEPIIVARKPFKGSLVDNVIEYGVGGINIDECRIGTEERTYKGMSKHKPEGAGTFRDDNWEPKDIEVSVNGRFPANTILTYDESDFDEVCGGFPITGKESSSRYFYCAKASKKDRDEGLNEFENVSGANITGRKEGSAGLVMEGGKQNPFAGKASPNNKNTHPTVKPTDLMQYLVRLVTPNGGIVLDPFNGSGSTGKAVMYENKERNKNYKYIGIELTEEYLPISKARIEYVCNLTQEELKEKQLSIFDLGDNNE